MYLERGTFVIGGGTPVVEPGNSTRRCSLNDSPPGSRHPVRHPVLHRLRSIFLRKRRDHPASRAGRDRADRASGGRYRARCDDEVQRPGDRHGRYLGDLDGRGGRRRHRQPDRSLHGPDERGHLPRSSEQCHRVSEEQRHERGAREEEHHPVFPIPVAISKSTLRRRRSTPARGRCSPPP